ARRAPRRHRQPRARHRQRPAGHHRPGAADLRKLHPAATELRGGPPGAEQGKLTLIDNTIDAATGTIHLKAEFANEQERLWPGEFVNVRVMLGVRSGVPTVPSEAVQQGPDGYIAYVVKPGDTVDRRSVQVASIENGVAAVTEGLSPGERVVISGQYRLTNGAHIAPMPPGPAAAATGGQAR